MGGLSRNDNGFIEKGWECPKCGAVMSPTTSRCVNCRGFGEASVSTNCIPAAIKALGFNCTKEIVKENNDDKSDKS